MIMTLPVAVAAPASIDTELLAVGCFEGEAPRVDGLEEALARGVERIAGRQGWSGREEQWGETAVEGDGIRPGVPEVVALHGLGKRGELTFRKLEAWLDRAVEAACTNGVRRLAFLLPEHAETCGETAALRLARTAALLGYRYDLYLTERAARPGLEEVVLVPPAAEEAAFRAALSVAGPVAGAVAFARDLANAPANEASPDWLEERARALAASHGMAIEVLDADELARRGMGGLLAVGSGSARPPRLLKLAWGEAGPVIALVGKGVTFDSGGISIKPAADMDEMKYDKSGACTVLGIARAVAELGLPVRLRVYVPVAENMLDGRSYRPGDIVRCYNGKTVEITNTDAEGRMILADALAWAVEEGPDALLELSTLTGACVVALGHQAAGLYSPDDELAAELLRAGEATGDRLWRLPLWPEFAEEMKGAHADLKNSAGRWGGANTAAAFLGQFVGSHRRWAHLDIAGVAYLGNDEERKKGATGFGVAAAVHWLRTRAGARG